MGVTPIRSAAACTATSLTALGMLGKADPSGTYLAGGRSRARGVRITWTHVEAGPRTPLAGLEEFLADGLGGGALGVPLFGIAGGYALAGNGRRWGRIICGVIALIPIPIWVLTVSDFGGPDLASTARGAWTALYFWSYLAVLALGCAIRLRRTA